MRGLTPPDSPRLWCNISALLTSFLLPMQCVSQSGHPGWIEHIWAAALQRRAEPVEVWSTSLYRFSLHEKRRRTHIWTWPPWTPLPLMQHQRTYISVPNSEVLEDNISSSGIRRRAVILFTECWTGTWNKLQLYPGKYGCGVLHS